jgi:uncharacterized repeat protein (TIGR02543 family)
MIFGESAVIVAGIEKSLSRINWKVQNLRLRKFLTLALISTLMVAVGPVVDLVTAPAARASNGLNIYFKHNTSPNASSKTQFTTGTCGTATGIINYANDSSFPGGCNRDYFIGYATGFFKAPITGDITFYLTSDDSSNLVININGTNQELLLSDCCRTASRTFTGFVANQTYSIQSYFTEIGGLAQWQLWYGWSAQNGFSAQSQTIVPLSALSTFQPHTVSFSANSGAGSPSVASVTQASTGASVSLATVGSLNRGGYLFSGWNTAADGSGTPTLTAGASYTPSSSLTLFAQWNSTIQYNGNENTGGTVPASTTAKSSAAVTTLATNSGNLTRTGYIFGGWNTNSAGTGTNYSAGLTTYSSPGNITLYAQWNSVVTYNGNGSTSGSVPANSTLSGTAGTLATNSGSLARTVGGVTYTFAGWNTNETGTGTSYAAGATNYPPSGAKTLFAQWNSTVTYNSNSPTSGTVPASTSIPPGGGSLATNTGNLTKTGATFVGWGTLANGLGTFYAPGASYPNTGNVTLFAQYSTTLAISGDSTLTTNVGTAATSLAYSVTGGLGNKTFTHTVSPANSGITIDTATANTALIKVSSFVPGGVYVDTLTVSDSRGETVTRVVTITVVAPLRFATNNETRTVTSVGKSTSVVISTANGGSDKRFTKTSISSPSSAGITLDTATASSGVATLNVSSSVLAGTYIESITATDASGILLSYQITIVVNPAPVLTFESATAGSNFTSLTMSTGNYVTIPASNAWQLGSTYTIEWWQYQTDYQLYPRVFKVGGLEVSLESGTFYYWVSGARVMNSAGMLDVKNQWVHFAIVSRNNSVTLYQDGKALKAAQTLPTVNSSVVPSGSQFCLATQCNNRDFSTFGGQITNFQISTIDRYSGISLSAANFTPSKFVTIDNNTILALTSVNSDAKMTDASSASRITTNVGSPTGSSRHPAASSSSVTVVTTQGLATRSSPFTASSGTGNKTFTLTPTISGITLDTSTLNTAVIVLDPSLAATNSTTAATYNESVTATDTLNSSTAFNVRITVNPRIALTATTQSLTTSSGVAAYDTITATSNTGTGAITFSLTSNPVSSGITLVSNGARSTVLTVARTVPQGTYYETITATDSLGSTTSIPVTVVVNPGISLVGEGSVSTITTSVGRTASLQVNALNGSSGKTFTMAPTIAGITLNTTNAASGYAVVQVANTVLANTYLETVTVTDSAGGTARLMVTIIVNAAPTLTGPTTVAMTAGRAASTTVYTTASGSGTKTFSLSGLNAGVTIETSTPTTAFVRLASSLTSTSITFARTITETVTATDASGATARITLTITVNPAVIETATALSVTTTSGVAASTTVFATQGTGNKTFTRTSATASAGITMTTLVTNQAVISVAATVSSGTYFETITATDTLGAETSTVITITVNGAPTVSGATNLVTTFGVAFTSPVFTAASGNGTYTFSLVSNPVNAGITVSSTANSQARVSISSSVATGTYNETLTVTDGLGATGRMNFTIRVNAPVALTGTQSVNATYGEAFTTGFNSSGGTGPFVFSATNICAVSRSTYIGDGNNGTVNGTSYTVDQILGDGTCNWLAPSGVTSSSVLVVAGGGGGGSRHGGGGGAGGVLQATNYSVVPGNSYAVSVGAGGAGAAGGASSGVGSVGSNSYFGGASGSTSLVANGGGNSNGNGGSGGGSNYGSGGSATVGIALGTALSAGTTNVNINGVAATIQAYGNAGGSGRGDGNCTDVTNGRGWCGGGGGGASAAGTAPAVNSGTQYRAGNGGNGISIAITGTPTTYGGGGGAGAGSDDTYANVTACNSDAPREGYGGTGGGGYGSNCLNAAANGQINSGGGGGAGGYAYISGGSNQNARGGNGGSGVVVVRYVTPTVDADNSKISYLVSSAGGSGTAGLLTLSIPESVSAGSYSHTVKVTDSTGAVSTPVTINITVAKANPVLTLSLPAGATSTSYGFGVTLSAQASTGGTVNFRDNGTTITGCGSKSTSAFVATCRWVPSTVATRTISAVFTPTDTANYNSGITTTMSIVVTQADTLTVTARSESFVFTDTTTAVTRGFTIIGLAEIDSATAVTMTYIGAPNDTTSSSWSSTTAPRLAGGNYEIRPSALVFTAGASGNYRAITYVSGNLEVTRAAQVANFNYRNNNLLTYSLGGTETTTVTKLGEALPVFSQTTPDKCSVNSSTGLLSILEAGTCSVTMDIPEGFNYLTTTISKNVTIAKAARTITLAASALTIKYGDTATVTTTVSTGALDGLITYTASAPTSCAFDEPSGEITATAGSGTCGLTARIAEGINFLGDTSTALSITTAKADGPEVRVGQTIPVAYTGSTSVITPTFTVSGLKLTDVASTSVTFTFTNVGDTAYSSTTAPTLGGTYRINPSALSLTSGSLANYNSPVYVFAEFVIESIDQPELILTNLTGDLTFPVTLTTTGGHPSTPAVTYSAINGTATNCRIAYGVLSNSGGQSVWYLQADSAGNCAVIATKPADRNYRVVISDTSTVTVLEFRVYVAPVVENVTTGITITPTVPLTKGPDVCTTGCVPRILSMDFYTRYVGDMLVMTGINFTGTTQIIFNVFTPATNFSVDSDTQITVQVPIGLPAGEIGIEVVAPGGTSARNFDLEIL